MGVICSHSAPYTTYLCTVLQQCARGLKANACSAKGGVCWRGSGVVGRTTLLTSS